MAKRDVIVVGASAGGVEAIRNLLAGVPADLDAAILAVVHVPASGGTALGRIFDRAGPLPAATAVDGEHLEPGRVYVARADRHLVVSDGHVLTRRGPRENGHRPSVDVLFRSAARHYGRRVIGVVLSGTLDDGSAGLHAVRRQGGLAIVQEPDDAQFESMPRRALETAGADHVATAHEIGTLLGRLAKEEVDDDLLPVPAEYITEVLMMEQASDAPADRNHPGTPSSWPCPDCDGVLWTIDDGGLLRFRCRVGHGWSAESLVERQGQEIESALWVALRSLEDRAALSSTLAERAEAGGRRISADRFKQDLADLDRSIDVLRRLLQVHGSEPISGSDA